MADYYSTQYNAAVVTKKGTQLKASDWRGKLRAYFCQFSGANLTAGSDTLYALRLPKGSRVLGGRLTYSGASTGAVSVGYSGATARYLGATTISTAGGTDVANTQALNHGDLLTADTDIIITPTTTTTGSPVLTLVMYVAEE